MGWPISESNSATSRLTASAEAKLAALLGEAGFTVDPQELARVETATFATSARVLAILRPQNLDELQKLIAITQELNLAVYPISRGRNWGLGSSVPARDNCALLDLSRMNRILDFNEELSFITVEPGVTFAQVAEFLTARGSNLFLSVIGGPPDASLVGNALERGEGLGPLGERTANVCGLEIVLADGKLLKTGFSGVANSKVSPLHRPGIGPSLDSLFFQSNFGVVARMTFWLNRRPAAFSSFCFAVPNATAEFSQLIANLRELQGQGVLKPCALALWNSYKFLASTRQYPFELSGSAAFSDPRRVLDAVHPRWKDSAWFGFGALYSASAEHARADRRLLKAKIKQYVKQLVLINAFTAKLAGLLGGLIGKLTGVDVAMTVRTLYSESVYQGHPAYTSLKSVFWRKRQTLPDNHAEIDPNREGCGVIWLCHALPFAGADILQAAEIIERAAFASGFEPNIAMVNISERVLHLFVAIIYDRAVAGDDQRAMDCHDQMFSQLQAAGYSAYRLGIHSMRRFADSCSAPTYVRQLKAVFDPQNLISPGRYDVT